MGVYFRDQTVGATSKAVVVAKGVWDLDQQLNLLTTWFVENPTFDFSSGGWVVDVGYEPRSQATVAGYTISVSLMRTLVERNVTLWLTDYFNKRDDGGHA